MLVLFLRSSATAMTGDSLLVHNLQAESVPIRPQIALMGKAYQLSDMRFLNCDVQPLIAVALHCRGVLNRDMKPENLLLKAKHSCQDARCTMENLRCVDFGSAAVLEDGELRRLICCIFLVGSRPLTS